MKKAIFRLIAVCAFMLLFVWNIALTFYCDALQEALLDLSRTVSEGIILAQEDAHNMTNITMAVKNIEELNSMYIDERPTGR